MVRQRTEQGTPAGVTKTQEMAYEITVGEVMSTTIFTVRPDQTMADLSLLLRDNRISGTPVVENGKLVGMVSIADLVNALGNNEINALIREKMKTSVECLYSDELLVHCLAKFSKYLSFVIVGIDIIRCAPKHLAKRGNGFQIFLFSFVIAGELCKVITFAS